ncbi:Uncharacterized protein R07B1.8 [Toxocara canis]|uniref:Uncharacterized protein R07B1.8 n=1 Tax=Toxocara canis TaxID=6265 RepID=A0A0B2UX81_TOXCA|nr:Uncharacterized protein R07B1.8 [Toxocara canis]
MKRIFHHFVLFLLALQAHGQCADQLQLCAIAAEDYERQIEEIKTAAFQNCFSRPSCQLEWSSFEECFHRSLNAVRPQMSQRRTYSDSFADTAQSYRDAVDSCFLSEELPPQLPDLSSLIIDEDAVYAHIVYGVEYANRLWGLPEIAITRPSLDSTAVCLVRETTRRVFGNGISRIIDSADPELNNVNTSCVMDDSEIRCYRRFLDGEPDFQQLLMARDRVLRACVQSVRLQTQCRSLESSRLRTCLCAAREEFETRMQASILECTKKSDFFIGPNHRIAIDKSKLSSKNSQAPDQRLAKLLPSLQKPQFDAPNTAPLTTSSRSHFDIAQGSLVNGQCLCLCERQASPAKEYPDALFGGIRHSVLAGQQPHLAMVAERPQLANVPTLDYWKRWYTQQMNELSRNHDIFNRYYDQYSRNQHMGM